MNRGKHAKAQQGPDGKLVSVVRKATAELPASVPVLFEEGVPPSLCLIRHVEMYPEGKDEDGRLKVYREARAADPFRFLAMKHDWEKQLMRKPAASEGKPDRPAADEGAGKVRELIDQALRRVAERAAK